MTEPKTISVIIPTYNSAKYLPQAIDSVIAQLYPVFEIIVVNDGSTDDTDNVIKDYLDCIIYIKQPNAGPASGRNAGIKMAQGEYIAFLDADDIWMPDKVKEQMNVFQENPNAALVYSRAAVLNQKDNNLSSYTGDVYSGKIFEKLLENCPIVLTTVIVKSDVIKQNGGFNESLFTAEDTNLFLKIAKGYEIVCTDKVLAYYRKHNTNRSNRVDVKIGTLDNLDRIIKLFPDTNPRKYPPMEIAYVTRGKNLIRDYFTNSCYKECNATCKKILRISPFEPTVFFYYFITKFPYSILDVSRKFRKNCVKY